MESQLLSTLLRVELDELFWSFFSQRGEEFVCTHMSFASRKRILSFVHFSDIFSGLHFLCVIKIAENVQLEFSAVSSKWERILESQLLRTPLIVELDEFFGAFLQREIKNLYPHFRVWEENFQLCPIFKVTTGCPHIRFFFPGLHFRVSLRKLRMRGKLIRRQCMEILSGLIKTGRFLSSQLLRNPLPVDLDKVLGFSFTERCRICTRISLVYGKRFLVMSFKSAFH